MVGPGIARNGVDSTTWTDHTNLRPTILSLTGLKDDYAEDGHVIVQALDRRALPNALQGSIVPKLEDAYEQVNAPFGQFAAATLKASTEALESNSAGDALYTSIESSIQSLTSQRDALATLIKTALNSATFDGTPINPSQAQSWIDQANQLITQAQALS